MNNPQRIIDQVGEVEVACSGLGIVTRNGQIVYDEPPILDSSQVIEIRVMKDGELIAVLGRKGEGLFEGEAIAPASAPFLCVGITHQGTIPINPSWDDSNEALEGDTLTVQFDDSNEKNFSGQPGET